MLVEQWALFLLPQGTKVYESYTQAQRPNYPQSHSRRKFVQITEQKYDLSPSSFCSFTYTLIFDALHKLLSTWNLMGEGIDDSEISRENVSLVKIYNQLWHLNLIHQKLRRHLTVKQISLGRRDESLVRRMTAVCYTLMIKIVHYKIPIT